MKTGETIRRVREDAEISQTELAKHLGISQQNMSFVEKGERYLHTDQLFLCAELLNVDPCYLLTGNSSENRKCAADELGLSDDTITNILRLDSKKKALLELLINDDGSIHLKADRKSKNNDFDKKPIPNPEYGFLDALSNYMNDPAGNRIVEVLENPDNPLAEPVIKQAPHRLRIQLADGSIHEVYEWKPDSTALLSRLKRIRQTYLDKLEQMQTTATSKEDDEE